MEIEETTMESAKKIVDLQDKCVRLEVEKTQLKGEVMELKAKEELMMEKHRKWKDKCLKTQEAFSSEKSKWVEETIRIGDECSQVMVEKKMIDIDLKAAEAEIKRLDIDLKAAEAEIKRLKSVLEARDGPVSNLLRKIKALEGKNCQLQLDLDAKKMRSQELEKTLLDLKSFCDEEYGNIAVLGRGKRKTREELVAESDEGGTKYMGTNSVSHENKHKKAMRNGNSECSGIEAERIDLNKALEADNKEMEKKIIELSERNAVLEASMGEAECAKKAMQDEHKKKVLELTQIIAVLEGEKREMEGKLIQANSDIREEIKRISLERMAVEAEKRAIKDEIDKEVLEQARRIEVLEWEIKEMEVEASEAKREKHEEIKRILNEEASLKEKHENENLELVSRVDVLERKKKEVEEEACKAIKVALKEKDDKIEEIKRILNEKARLKEQHDKRILEFVSRVNVLESDMEAEKAALKEKNSELVAKVKVLEKEKLGFETESREKNRMIKELAHQNEFLMTNAGISGTPAQNQGQKSIDISVRKRKAGCAVSKQVGIKRSKSESVCTTPENMSNALKADAELCMRSVCALYRKHGFMPPYEERGMALGKLLTRGDPKGVLKVSLAEFKRADPCGLENCRLIAGHHFEELFDIYTSNLDPLFSDDRN